MNDMNIAKMAEHKECMMSMARFQSTLNLVSQSYWIPIGGIEC
jgi:hypothetical protein